MNILVIALSVLLSFVPVERGWYYAAPAAGGAPSYPYVVASAVNSVFEVGTTGVVVTHGFTLADFDVLYAFCGQGDDTGGPWASASGGTWTLLSSGSTSTGNDCESGVLRRTVSSASGEPSTYTFTVGSSGSSVALTVVLVQVRNEFYPTPEDATTTTTTGTNDFTPDNVDITTGTNTALVLAAHVATPNDGGAAGKTAGAPSGFDLSGDDDEADQTTAGFDVFVEVGDDENKSAGAQSIGVWTGTADDATSEWHTYAVSVEPGPTSAPGTATLSTPADDATGVSVAPTFDWSDATDAYTYQIQVDNNSDFSSPLIDQSGIAVSTYSGSGLSVSTEYFWRVMARNQVGSGSWSSTFSFTTSSTADPAVVQSSGTVQIAGSTSFPKAFGSNVTSGNRGVVATYKWTNTTADEPIAGDCTQTAGTATIGSITLDKVQGMTVAGGQLLYVAIWSFPITGSGSLTMGVATVTADGGIAVGEISNVSGIDVSGNGTAGTGAPATSTFTTTANTAIFGVLATFTGSSTTHTPSTDYTQIIEEENGASFQTGGAVYRVALTTLTNETCDWTAPTTVDWAIVAVAYK